VKIRDLLVAGSLVGVAAVSARTAHAQTQPSLADRARAREAFQAGVAAYRTGDYTAALDSFQAAYNAAPHPSVRINIANCFMQLHRPVDAMAMFEMFLAESTSIPLAQRREVERQVAQLRTQLGEVTVSVEPAAALNPTATIDGAVVSTVRSVRVGVGHHTLEVRADGFEPHRREIDVTAGAPATLRVSLRARAAGVATNAVATVGAATNSTSAATANTTPIASGGSATTSTAAAEPHPPPAAASAVVTPPATSTAQPSATGDASALATAAPHTGSDTGTARGLPPALFIAAASFTGAAAIAWGIFGAVTLGANGTFEDAVRQGQAATNPADRDFQAMRGMDAYNTVHTFRVLSDISMGLTIAGAVTSVVLVTQTNFRPRAAVSASALPGGGALSVTGRF